MSPISGLGPTPPPAPPTPRTAARAAGFTMAPNTATRGGMPAPAAAEVSLGGLLALQEADAEEVRDRDARRRGRDLLDELAALQRDLLRHGPDAERLGRLAALAEAMPVAVDPRLRAVVQAIVLRAQVEGAKLAAARAALGRDAPE